MKKAEKEATALLKPIHLAKTALSNLRQTAVCRLVIWWYGVRKSTVALRRLSTDDVIFLFIDKLDSQ